MMPKRIKIKGEPHLYKDAQSKAVISTDKAAIEKYQRARQHRETQITEINSLKAEIQEVKDLLLKLLEERKD